MNATVRQGLLAARIALAQAKESSAALPPGNEVEGGTHPARVPLSAFCDGCGKATSAKNLTLVGGQSKQSAPFRWWLVCGACFVDGL